MYVLFVQTSLSVSKMRVFSYSGALIWILGAFVRKLFWVCFSNTSSGLDTTSNRHLPGSITQ